MNKVQLKQINQIQAITEQTVSALTEPIQPQYLMLKPEQYNLLAENISTIGNAIVENTDLISELPTHQDLNDLTVRVLRPYTEKMEETASSKMNSIQYSVEDKLLKQTDILKKSIQSELRNMMTELKAKDLTPWKLKLKWILTGAILPSTLLIWQLICR